MVSPMPNGTRTVIRLSLRLRWGDAEKSLQPPSPLLRAGARELPRGRSWSMRLHPPLVRPPVMAGVGAGARRAVRAQRRVVGSALLAPGI